MAEPTASHHQTSHHGRGQTTISKTCFPAAGTTTAPLPRPRTHLLKNPTAHLRLVMVRGPQFHPRLRPPPPPPFLHGGGVSVTPTGPAPTWRLQMHGVWWL